MISSNSSSSNCSSRGSSRIFNNNKRKGKKSNSKISKQDYEGIDYDTCQLTRHVKIRRHTTSVRGFSFAVKSRSVISKRTSSL